MSRKRGKNNSNSRKGDDIAGEGDINIPIPIVNNYLSPMVSVVPLQLIAYHAALALGCDVDRPRNLAKSVTASNDSKRSESLFFRLPLEWLVPQHVVCMTHFDYAHLSANIIIVSFHYQMNYSIREIIFYSVFTKLLVVLSGHLTDKE